MKRKEEVCGEAAGVQSVRAVWKIVLF